MAVRRCLRRLALGVVTAAVGLTLMTGVASAKPVAPAHPVTVPLTTRSVTDGQSAYDFVVVTIRVGGGPPVPVQLDTGSTGLVVLSSAVGPAGHRTSQRAAIGYASGTVTGQIATGSVTIGGLTTKSSTAFVEVPPNARSVAHLHNAMGVDGIMGIGMANGESPAFPYSPLLQLPSPYWQGVTVQVAQSGAGSLTIGPVQAPAGAVSLPMLPAAPSTYPNGVPAYQKDPDMCWSAGAGAPNCAATDMDLGAPQPLFGPGTLPGAQVVDSSVIAPGTQVSATTSSGTPIWSFTTGERPPTVVILLQQGYTQFNTGIGFFFTHTVAYNVAAGKFVVWPSGSS